MADSPADQALAQPEHSRAATIFVLCFLAMGIAITILFNWFAAHELYKQHDALTNWPSTQGEILTSQITDSYNVGNEATVYRPEVQHRYSVNAVEFIGSNATPFDTAASKSWAWSVISQFKPGDTVPVYYNPSEPSRSFVHRYWNDAPLLIALFASLFPCFIAFLVTTGGKNKYALKWQLPAIGSLVFAAGLATSATIYFTTVPPTDHTPRAQICFAIAVALLIVAVALTYIWHARHMNWRRNEAHKRAGASLPDLID